MNDLELHIQQFLKRYPASDYIVACSGGVDSVTLFSILKQLKFPVSLAHVNYHLRDEDSELDEAFVRNLAAKNKVPFHLKSVDLNAQLQEGGNLQQLARTIRYTFFEELVSASPKSMVLLAHQKEDQTETFFMNVFRDSGVMGLAGMPEKREHYLRPFLNTAKHEIIEYAEANSIQWREDRTNATSKYTRNKLRNLVLPELRKEFPNLDDAVAMLTALFQDAQTELSRKMETVLSGILSSKQLKIDAFEALSTLEKIELLRQMGQAFGLLATWNKLNQKGTAILLESNANCPFDQIVHDGRFFSFVENSRVSIPQLHSESCSKLPESFTKNELYLDVSKIKGELHFRKPKRGDRIQPIGMKGSRLVSDVISDAKMDSHSKRKLFLLCDDESVLWVPALCISRKAIANEHSEKIQKIVLLPEDF